MQLFFGHSYCDLFGIYCLILRPARFVYWNVYLINVVAHSMVILFTYVIGQNDFNPVWFTVFSNPCDAPFSLEDRNRMDMIKIDLTWPSVWTKLIVMIIIKIVLTRGFRLIPDYPSCFQHFQLIMEGTVAWTTLINWWLRLTFLALCFETNQEWRANLKQW